jgi:hypothetical protein
LLLLKAHELNGCIVGPGLYQEWTAYIHAAKHSQEQNLELCRSLTNNMLYYRVVKPIRKGDCLLAWYSANVEAELAKSLLNRESIYSKTQMNCESKIAHHKLHANEAFKKCILI